MAQRINALVHGGMSAEEAAEIIGIDPSALVQHGNGYAIVTEAIVADEAETGLDADEDEAEEMDPALDS
jgi:hypothetical protein